MRVGLLRALPLAFLLVFAALPAGAAGQEERGGKRYLFCFWNVENFFDDRFDAWPREPDKSFDAWFAKDKEALPRKLALLTQVLLKMNGGKGPDIIALAEVESYRAAELLQQALNERLRDRRDHYGTVVFKAPSGAGRGIACALITRLKVDRDRARILGKRQRILEAHLEAEGRELIVIVSHWTSRLTDKTGAARGRYGNQVYGRYKAIATANPRAAVLACGDFNDDPTDDSVVKHLRATGDRRAVVSSAEPLLYNPFVALKEAGKGSHYHGAKAHVFDQACLSRGLLTGPGWSYVEGSARIVPEIAFRGRPNRFGGPRDKRAWSARGASDHFPITLELRVGR
jgi:endonuclease/exonuclease/phosphatase family metal-dependent hydrolase